MMHEDTACGPVAEDAPVESSSHYQNLQRDDIPIDADYEFAEDGDSALGGGSHADTTSLHSDIYKFRFENNRRYHAYKDGEYWAPNDDQQNNELDIAHHLYLVVLRNKLFLAPIGDSPQRVLDVGTGTGIWAIDFADQYSSAEVVGFDLSPIQPTWIPPNVRFEINDACSDDWAYRKNSFDFVHVRLLYGSIADWPAFYRQAMMHLKPGGYIEQVELSVDPTSDDGTVTYNNIFAEWGRTALDLGDTFGKTLRIHDLMEGYLEEAGFEHVTLEKFKMPIGPWSKDPYLKQVGMWNMLDWQEGIEGWCVGLLTRLKGWSYAEIQAYLGKVRVGLKDRRIHAWQYLKVVHARKPLN